MATRKINSFIQHLMTEAPMTIGAAGGGTKARKGAGKGSDYRTGDESSPGFVGPPAFLAPLPGDVLNPVPGEDRPGYPVTRPANVPGVDPYGNPIPGGAGRNPFIDYDGTIDADDIPDPSLYDLLVSPIRDRYRKKLEPWLRRPGYLRKSPYLDESLMTEAPMTTSGAGPSKTSKGKGGKTEYKDDDQRGPGLYVNPDSVDPGHPDNLHDYKPFGEKPRWPIPSWDNPSNIDDRFPQYPAPYNHPKIAPKPYTPYLVPEPDGGVRQPYLPRPVKDRRPTFRAPHDKYKPIRGPY